MIGLDNRSLRNHTRNSNLWLN